MENIPVGIELEGYMVDYNGDPVFIDRDALSDIQCQWASIEVLPIMKSCMVEVKNLLPHMNADQAIEEVLHYADVLRERLRAMFHDVDDIVFDSRFPLKSHFIEKLDNIVTEQNIIPPSEEFSAQQFISASLHQKVDFFRNLLFAGMHVSLDGSLLSNPKDLTLEMGTSLAEDFTKVCNSDRVPYFLYDRLKHSNGKLPKKGMNIFWDDAQRIENKLPDTTDCPDSILYAVNLFKDRLRQARDVCANSSWNRREAKERVMSALRSIAEKKIAA